MVTWDSAIQDCQDLSGDTSSSASTFFKRQMNKGYKIILAELNRPTQEVTLTMTTPTLSNPLAYSDRVYMLPNDALWPRSIKILIGSQYIPLIEEESQDIWDYRTAYVTSGIPSTYFVKERFGVGGLEILVDPIPAAGYTVEIVYEASDKDLSQSAYATGTTSVNYGSSAVTSAGGATFTSAMIGRYWQSTDATSDGMWYRIVAVPSSSTLTLENKYQGAANQSGVAFTINEIFNIPEDCQQCPGYFAMWQFYLMKKDANNAGLYLGLFKSDLEDSKQRWAKKTDNNLIRSKGFARWKSSVPAWFPGSGISS